MRRENSLTRLCLLRSYRGSPSASLRAGFRLREPIRIRESARFAQDDRALCDYCTGCSWVESWLTAVTS
jgi:hypothetical protein